MRVKILSGSEVQALLAFLEKCSLRDQLLIRLMLQCGLRIGEVSALNVEDVWRQGFTHPAVNVRQGTTKGHVARYVDISADVRDLIDRYVKSINKDREIFQASFPLFIGRKRGGRLHVSGIGRIVSSISILALGRAVNPHTFRHTYATILLKYTNLRVVQTLLGHARLSTTEIYTHPTSEECTTAVNRAWQRPEVVK